MMKNYLPKIIDVPYEFVCSFPSPDLDNDHPYKEKGDNWKFIRDEIKKRKEVILKVKGKELLFEIVPIQKTNSLYYLSPYLIYFTDNNGNYYGEYNAGKYLLILSSKEFTECIKYRMYEDLREYY